MSRFFTKKSTASFSLAIALVGLFSFGVSSVAKAQQSTGPGDIYASQPVTPAPSTPPVAPSPTGFFSFLSAGNLLGKAIGGVANTALTIIAYILELVAIPIAAVFLTVAGKIIDFAVAFSIYGNGFHSFIPTVQSIWTIARDTCNVAFIFILLYIAIRQIIGQAGAELKKTLTSVVIAALFINFSLFFTELIIDGGNLVATALLNQITSSVCPAGTTASSTAPIYPGTSVRCATIQQSALGAAASKVTGATNDFFTGVVNGAAGGATGISTTPLSEHIMDVLQLQTAYQDPGILAVSSISIIKSVIRLVLFLVTAFVFFFMAFLLVGRLVMLIFLAATAPLGFMGGTIPFMDKVSKSWWDSLLNQTLVAPVFMFCMLVIIKVGQQVLVATNTPLSSTDPTANMVIYFNYVFIIILLIKAVDITKGFSGEVGKIANTAATTLTGAALGAATGGTALIARQTIGRGAAAIAASERMKSLATADSKQNLEGKGFGARMALRATGITSRLGMKGAIKTSESSLDVRETNEAKGTLGFLKGQGIDLAGDNAKAAQGGFVGARKRAVEAEAKFAKENLGRKELNDTDALLESEKKLPNIQNRSHEALRKLMDTSNNLAAERARGAAADQNKINQYIKDIDKYDKEEKDTTKLASSIMAANRRGPDGNLIDDDLGRKARIDVIKYIKAEYQRGYAEIVENSITSKLSGEYKMAADQIRKDFGEDKLADLTKALNAAGVTPGTPPAGGPATPPPAPGPVGP